MKLKNKHNFPPGGFPFIDRDGTTIPTNGLTFDQVVLKIRAHRVNNQVPASFDLEMIGNELEAFTCQRLAHDPNWCVDIGTENSKKNVLKRLRRASAGVAQLAGKAKAFSNVMIDWLGAGQKPVENWEAKRRSQICLQCPKREMSNRLEATVAEAIRKQTEKKNSLGLHVPREEELQSCGACHCHLPLKIWVPDRVIHDHTPADVYNRLHPDCWMMPGNKGRILTVIPFYSGDYKLTRDLLQWIKDLGGVGNRQCLLVFDNSVSNFWDLQQLAMESFLGGANQFAIDDRFGKWPKGPAEMFIRAARHISDKFRMPWLWLEPDAIPLRPDWLKKLEEAYFSYGTPFLGPFMDNKYLAGVSVYPKDFGERYQVDTNKPFDLQNADRILPNATNTKLIHQYWGKDLQTSPHFMPYGSNKKDNEFWPDEIHPDAVIYHRCKDGSLIDCLRNAPYVKHRWNRDYTVVITSYRRPKWLADCLASVMNAGVRNIIITSADPCDETRKVLKEAESVATVLIQDEDPGNNASWLAGVDAVKTTHVHLLHEDDLLMPHFDQVVREVLGTENIDMVLFDGEKHFDSNRINESYTSLPYPGGVYPTKICLPILMNRKLKTFSPIAGIFPTQFMRDVLAECQAHMINRKVFWHHRKTMIVGNDLLIWLRACQKLGALYYIKKSIVSYGHHNTSISYVDAHREESELLPKYNLTRDYFVDYCPKIYHLVQTRDLPETPEGNRVRRAMETWNVFYETGIVKPLHLHDSRFERNTRHLGEERGIPFLKDLLSYGLSKTNDSDLIVLTNDDTILHPNTMWAVWDRLQKQPAIASFRLNVETMPRMDGIPPWELARRYAQPTSGRDLFAFRKSWLSHFLDQIPDYAFGFTDWDSTLAVLIRLSLGRQVNKQNWLTQDPRIDLPLGYVLHEDHIAMWTRNMDSPGNTHNRRQTEYFKQNLNLQFDPWVNPSPSPTPVLSGT